MNTSQKKKKKKKAGTGHEDLWDMIKLGGSINHLGL